MRSQLATWWAVVVLLVYALTPGIIYGVLCLLLFGAADQWSDSTFVLVMAGWLLWTRVMLSILMRQLGKALEVTTVGIAWLAFSVFGFMFVVGG